MTRKKSRKRILISTLFGFILLIVSLFIIRKVTLNTYYYAENIVCSETARTSNPNISKTTLILTKNSTINEIAQSLYEDGLITDKKYFLLEAKLEDSDRGFVPGEYSITSSMSVPDILELITNDIQAGGQTVNIIIPEGATINQIASSLQSKGLIEEKEDFLQAITQLSFDANYTFLQNIPPNESYKYKLEGYLAPGSYIFRKDSTPEELIIAMLDQFEEIISRYATYTNGSSYSLHELLTMASLVEVETKLENERPLIAGVIYNRLNADLPLELSSAMQYALNKRRSTINLVDIKKESAYNTYINPGLPIGPICNPGEASIKAVLFSTRHDYLYFVSDNKQTGSHFFTSSFSDHTYRKHLYDQLNDLNFIE